MSACLFLGVPFPLSPSLARAIGGGGGVVGLSRSKILPRSTLGAKLGEAQLRRRRRKLTAGKGDRQPEAS